MTRLAIALLTTVVCWPWQSWAQQVPTDPASTHIFPAGGRRGTAVNVRIGSECLPPGARLRFRGEGVTAPAMLGRRAARRQEPSPRRKPIDVPVSYPQEWESQVTIAADAPLGQKLWRLSCGRGGTGARPFIVGDLPELIESEPNSSPQTAQHVTLPVTINGQIAGERDMDYFQFFAPEGQVVVADMAAARLGSVLDPVVEFQNLDGQTIAAERFHVGSDPVLVCRIPAAGEYRLLIANVTFRGGPEFVYRLTLAATPFVRAAFPAGWQAGQSRELMLFALAANGPPSVLREPVNFDRQRRGEFWYTSSAAPMSPLVLEAGAWPEVIESEPNDSPQQAMPLTLPVTANGQFLTPGDEDWYSFTASKDQLLAIDCRVFPPGSPTLPSVAVVGENGNVLAQANCLDDPDRQCRLEWHATTEGRFRLRVRNVQPSAGNGPEAIYRLSVRQSVPDFALSLASDFANVVPGGKSQLELKVSRRGGCDDPIALTVTGLPAGVRIEPMEIPANQSILQLTIEAAADAQPTDATLQIAGTATIGGEHIERMVTARHLGCDALGIGLGTSSINHLQLTVQHKPVFKLFCSEAYQYAHRGTVYPYLMQVERLDGFDGPIHLEVANRQIMDLDGIEVREITVPAGVNQFMLPIYLPETMHINIQPHSNVYCQAFVQFKDTWGQDESLLVVSTMRCMIRTLPTVVKLKAQESEVTVKPGDAIVCHLLLERTANFSGGMRIELVEPAAADGFLAEPVAIASGQSSAVVTVRIPATLAPATSSSAPVLRFRATGELAGDTQVISETSVPLRSK